MKVLCQLCAVYSGRVLCVSGGRSVSVKWRAVRWSGDPGGPQEVGV